MGLTTDRNDPRLGHGVDKEEVPQNEVYLILSEEERAKGFIRPVRNSYQHVGVQPIGGEVRDLTEQEKERFSAYDYVKFERYADSGSSVVGRYWTQEQLSNKGCGGVTIMGNALSETYARDPKFYGSTYCVGCKKHLPVNEFVWDKTNERVGS